MVAIRTNSTLGTNFTQATLIAAIKTAMLAAGFNNPVDDYSFGSDRIFVYAFVTDATKTYGTVYYRIKVTAAFAISATIHSSWNSTNHTGNNGSLEFIFATLANTNTVIFTSLNGGTEYKFVFLTQALSTIIPLGVISPANKPNWWDLNQWNYAFFWNANTLNALTGTTLNPYANNNYTAFLNDSRMGAANVQTGLSDILTGVLFFTNANRGVTGKSSEDLGSGAVLSSSRYNTIPSDTVNQDYLIINPVAGGLVIKVQS